MQTKITIVGIASFCTYMCTYLFNLSMENMEQYLAVVAVLWLDGIFGIWAGIKREGFKTYKAIKILKTLIFWVIMLTLILVIEKSIPGASWLSETMLMPLVIFQLISTVKVIY